MGRKRKVPIAEEEKENENECSASTAAASSATLMNGPMYTIMTNVQLNETFHKRYIKELRQLYAKMDHNAFTFTFIKMIKSAMVAEETNEYAQTMLLFCAKFLSSYNSEDTHSLLTDTFKWLLTTISNNPHIRFRLCQFVNMVLNELGQEAALDDSICDSIMGYMMERLRDVSPSVRVQATHGMQRLQVPDNPDDPVLRAYQFHLCSDPSPRVRQAVITCMGRNYHTIPYILDRLWDIDEKVRRHTYLHMSSYPVRSYKVSQRLMLLEQGLNERSDVVRKVVTSVMLKQWIESYQKDLIALIAALKLDSDEEEINRFRKITQQVLKHIFGTQANADLLACLPLTEDGEFHRCVPHEKLTIEIALYWQCLTEYLQNSMAEELDLVVPELSIFCSYVERFCETQKPAVETDKFQQMEYQNMLLSLMQMLYTFDLGDEIGRGNLQRLLVHLLKTQTMDERVIEMVVRCAENLLTEQNERLHFLADIVRDICDLHPQQHVVVHNVINELLANSLDSDLTLKLSTLKVKLMDFDEQETNYRQSKVFVKANEIAEERRAAIDKHMHLLEKHATSSASQLTRVVNNDRILKGLQITFYMVVSPKVVSLNPSICKLYNDFICRHIASPQIIIRDWALKCGTAYSMLYETLAKDIFDELYSQFFKNHNIRIWETAITCIFELLHRYGVDNFVVQDHQIKNKKAGRQLYNTLEFLDADDDTRASTGDQGVGVIYMMSHFLDTCDDVCILRAIIKGFCCLVLRGFIESSEIIEKLLLLYFNPSTDSEINQMLGVFLENLIVRKQHALLQPCILPTIATVLAAPYDSPLHEIRPETIARFMIDATKSEVCAGSGSMHNKLALSFLQEMLGNVSNKELCKLLAKELLTLELNMAQHEQLKQEMKQMAERLIKSDFDSKTVKYIIDFKDMLDGVYTPPRRIANDNDSGDESKSDDETVATGVSSCTVASKTKENATESIATVPMLDENELREKEANVTEATITTTLVKPTAAAVAVAAAATADTTTPNEATAIRTPVPAATKSQRNKAHEPTAKTPVVTPAANPNTTASATPTPTRASAANKTPSPSARTPTTYGRDNVVGHRFLRKSLNLTRSQSDSETGDGPSRPNKIRIEARIDSDKKNAATDTATDPDQRSNGRSKSVNVGGRRNLRYADANSVTNENANTNINKKGNQNSRESTTATTHTTPIKSPTVEAAASKTTDEAAIANSPVKSIAAASAKNAAKPRPVAVRAQALTTRSQSRDRKQLAQPTTRQSERSRQAFTKTLKAIIPTTPRQRTDVESDDSDVIPDSPEVVAVTVTRLNALRQRKAYVSAQAQPMTNSRSSSAGASANSNISPLRRTRSAFATRELRSTHRAKVSTPLRTGTSVYSRAATPASTTTPLRNGRKRLLQNVTPKSSRVSPPRKQQRLEQHPQSRTSFANTASTVVSWRSRRQSAYAARHSISISNDRRSRSRSRSRSNSSRQRRNSIGSSLGSSIVPQSTANSIITRRTVRRQIEGNTIITRKRRLSMSQPCGRGGSTALLKPRSKSRIPVSASGYKSSQHTVSSSSSADDLPSKSKVPRLKLLATKLRHINVTPNCAQPLVMGLVRPRHASTDSAKKKADERRIAARAFTNSATTTTTRTSRRRQR